MSTTPRGDGMGNGLRQTTLPPALVKSIVEGRCILFAGAGFSRPVTGLDWGGLMARLKEDLPEVPMEEWRHLDPLMQAQYFVDLRGRPALEQMLKELLPQPKQIFETLKKDPLPPGLELRRRLATLPFPYIFTTNYDALVESILERERLPHTVLVDDDQVLVSYPPRLRRVIKVHGDLTLSDTIILSRDDYLNYARLRPGMFRLWQSLQLSHTFLFHGFGLTDPNFVLLFHDLVSLLPEDGAEPRAYALMTGVSRVMVDHWKSRGLHIIESRTFEAQDKKVEILVKRVESELHRQRDLPHLLTQLSGKVEGEGVPGRTLKRAFLPVMALLRRQVHQLWEKLPVPDSLRQGQSAQVEWHGGPLVDRPPRTPVVEEQAELLFYARRALKDVGADLSALDGEGPLGPPVSALVGAWLFRARRFEEAIVAMEEARFWYESRAQSCPWWLGRMLGRASRSAGDRPAAYDELSWCVRQATRIQPVSMEAASDASLFMTLALWRLARLQRRKRVALAREVVEYVIRLVTPVVPWLELGDTSTTYARRTCGYGSWHYGEILLDRGQLSDSPLGEVVQQAVPHLLRGVELLEGEERARCLRYLQDRLKDPLWQGAGRDLRGVLSQVEKAQPAVAP